MLKQSVIEVFLLGEAGDVAGYGSAVSQGRRLRSLRRVLCVCAEASRQTELLSSRCQYRRLAESPSGPDS